MKTYFLTIRLFLDIAVINEIHALPVFKFSKNGLYDRHKRSMLQSRLNSKWPGNIIPYQFDDTYTERDQRVVLFAMKQWSTFTCVKFIPTIRDIGDRLRFVNGSGCGTFLGRNGGCMGTNFSRMYPICQHFLYHCRCGTFLGRNGGLQPVILRKDCRIVSAVLHELGHALGFFHEQQRADRDSYVTIKAENILPSIALISQFTRQDRILVTNLGLPYDYKSIMHYPRKAFSFTGEDTIEARDPAFRNMIGTATRLSFLDVKRANIYLGCSESCSEEACPLESYKSESCECMCEDPTGDSPAVRCDIVEELKNMRKPKIGFQSLNLRMRLNAGLELRNQNNEITQGPLNSVNGSLVSLTNSSSSNNETWINVTPQNDEVSEEPDSSTLFQINDLKSLDAVFKDAFKSLRDSIQDPGKIFVI